MYSGFNIFTGKAVEFAFRHEISWRFLSRLKTIRNVLYGLLRASMSDSEADMDRRGSGERSDKIRTKPLSKYAGSRDIAGLENDFMKLQKSFIYIAMSHIPLYPTPLESNITFMRYSNK
jgi:hypothetical protein